MPLSRYTAERLPARALQFLRALSFQQALRTPLEAAGYKKEDHEEGWELFLRVSGARNEAPPMLAPNPATSARDELEAWQSEWLPRASAALQRKHPDEAHKVVAASDLGKRGRALIHVGVFLDGFDALDSEARATLEHRGITSAMRKHLRALLKTALTTNLEPCEPQMNRAAHEANVVALYKWLNDWSVTARTAFTKREDLIRLGLAKRRARKPSHAPEPAQPGGALDSSARMAP